MESKLFPLQWNCKFFTIFVLFYIGFLSGCSEETEPMIKVPDEQTTDGDVVMTSGELRELQDATFQELQHLFPPPILDEQFQKLHQISTSAPYLDFLENAYPNVKPYQNFKAFVKNSPPNAEVYTLVLKKHYGKATKEDIIVVHRLHQAFQKTRILIYHGTDRLAAETEVLDAAAKEEPVFEWVTGRLRDDEKVVVAFDADLQQLSEDIEYANIEKINQTLKEQRREGRPDDGFIWLMLTEPVLMGEVLGSFSDTGIFSKWLKREFKEPKLRF